MRTLRVAVMGAGPVAQAIHLPTLARLGDSVRLTEVMDVDADLAQRVATLHGARASRGLAELLAGDGFDVAVIGSPDRFHAEQIEAMCAAGVRGILVEKPLATTAAEVQRVVSAVKSSSVALVVGAMHTYDPAWLAARESFAAVGPFHARSAIYIPNNAHFEDMATTMARPQAPTGLGPSDEQRLRGGVMGLAIHNLPLIRQFVPVIDKVSFASTLDPWGYSITAAGPAGTVELLARVGGTWRPDWTLSVWGGESELELSFPPSYVHAGSATATVRSAAASLVFGPHPVNGYEAEWHELLGILDGAPPRYGIDHLVDDLAYAMSLADLTVSAFREGTGAAA